MRNEIYSMGLKHVGKQTRDEEGVYPLSPMFLKDILQEAKMRLALYPSDSLAAFSSIILFLIR